jgi:hypothetical protein
LELLLQVQLPLELVQLPLELVQLPLGLVQLPLGLVQEMSKQLLALVLVLFSVF